MFAKFRIEKPEYSERSVVSLPLLEAYDERIRHLLAENNQLRARKIQHSKIIQSQETEFIMKRSEIYQLQQELQVLREEVARTRQPVNPAKNTVKFNVSRHSYWEVNKSTRSVKRKKIREHIRNAVEILPAEFKPVEIKFDVSGRELVIPLSNDQDEADTDGCYTREVVQRILAAKDEGRVSDKAFHGLRMALPENVRCYVPPLSAILRERRNQNKEIKEDPIPVVYPPLARKS